MCYVDSSCLFSVHVYRRIQQGALNVYTCMCIYVYMYIGVYVYKCICINVYIHKSVYVYKSICIYVYMCDVDSSCLFSVRQRTRIGMCLYTPRCEYKCV